MKLISRDQLIQLDTEEHPLSKLVLEHKAYYRNFVRGLYAEMAGGGELFRVFEGPREYSLLKKFRLILQPTYVELVDRKSRSRIVERLMEASYSAEEERHIQDLRLGLQDLTSVFLRKTEARLSSERDFSLRELLQFFDFRLDSSSGSFSENLVEYILGLRMLEGISHFITLNLEDYMTEAELCQFYENMQVEQVSLVNIACRHTKRVYEEHVLILDQDLCVLEY